MAVGDVLWRAGASVGLVVEGGQVAPFREKDRKDALSYILGEYTNANSRNRGLCSSAYYTSHLSSPRWESHEVVGNVLDYWTDVFGITHKNPVNIHKENQT